MQIKVNGSIEDAREGLDVAELVSRLSDRRDGIAVALNNEVVPRSAWGSTVLADGDQVDVVTAVQGG